jgi:YesN/AraC family two-component response regulator
MRKLSVLYVEDNLETQELMKSVLEYDVENFYQAYNGEEGFNLCKKLKPDVVLTDITMPYLNGLLMAKKIKENNPDQVIIVLSGFEDRGLLKGARQLGINHFMPKPIDIDNLLSKLNKISLTFKD